MENTIYINNSTDYSVLSAAVASGYYFKNPVDSSSDYYTNTAESVTFNSDTFTQSFTGYEFNSNELVYKRTTNVNLSSVKYSEFSTIIYNLSGINDSTNTIVKIVFEPLSGIYQTVTYNGESLEFDKGLPYKFALGGNTNNNPKNILYPYDYNLREEDGEEKTFTSRFSAYRQDGLVDEYVIDILISRDSIYNVSDKMNLLDSQTLPLSSKDPLIKIELENPNYVNNFVLRRFVTPTQTRTITPSQTPDATPTRTPTPTFTRTRSQTPTATRTRTQTRTRSQSPTQTRTKSRTSTRGASPTRTVSPSESRAPRVAVPPTPPPSSPPKCNSKEVWVFYKGLNSSIDPSTVTLGLRYKVNDVISSFGVPLEKVTGENIAKVKIPVDYSLYNLEPFVYFTSDDPIITVTNWVTSVECSSSPEDTFNPPAKGTPPPVEPPPVISSDPPEGGGGGSTPPTEPPLFVPPVDPVVPIEPLRSVFSFGFGNVVDGPIFCNIAQQNEEPKIVTAADWYVNIEVNYYVFVSSLGIDQLRANIINPEDKKPIFTLPNGGTLQQAGTFSKRVTYNTIPVGTLALPMGPPIQLTSPSIRDLSPLNTQATFIIYKVDILNEVDDYDDYYRPWLDDFTDPCEIHRNWDLDIIKRNYPDFEKFVTEENGKYPVSHDANFSYIGIEPLVSYEQWEQDGYPFTHTVTRS